jgi:hypothetical protein
LRWTIWEAKRSLDDKNAAMNLSKTDLETKITGLQKARLLKQKRAQLKAGLKKGTIKMSDLAVDASLFEVALPMRVIELVSALSGYGKITAARLLDSLKIAPSKRLSGLGKRQKKAFYDYFKIN